MSSGISSWVPADSASGLYVKMGIMGIIFLTGAYILFLLFASDPLFWTLMFVPFGIGLMCLTLSVGILMARKYRNAFHRVFMIGSGDAVKLITYVLTQLSVHAEMERSRFNWLLLSRPEAVLILTDWNLKIEVYGFRGPVCSIYVESMSGRNDSRMKAVLQALDEAGRPAALD